MQRFLVFPLPLALAGAIFLALCWTQGTLTIWGLSGIGGTLGVDLPDIIVEIVQQSWPSGSVAGIVAGLGLAIWDLLRNRRDQSAITRLLPNLFWCGCYALLLIAVNGVLFTLGTSQLPLGQAANWVVPLPFLGAAVLNLTAIFWGAIHSITTKDVLTPRVWGDKLRVRARLGAGEA